MNITGIITEYNPFHLGHEFHLKKSKELTDCHGVICIMSGNFVQRGMPSIIDKWSRAQMALKSGVDLVVELPTIYSISSAEYFAFGAVSLLNSLGVVNNICFGSEYGDINLLLQIGKVLANETEEFKSLLKKELSLGLPFAKARSKALLKYLETSLEEEDLISILNSSNNILAIEYCKNLIRLNSKITPVTIRRLGSNYNDAILPLHSYASASAIRNSIYSTSSLAGSEDFLPTYSKEILSKCSISDIDKMFNYIKYNILCNPNILTNIPEASEGLDNKIIANLRESNSFHELIMSCKSKRYSYTRISRVLCQCFLGVSKEDILLRNSSPSYLRILGLNETGAKILKKIKASSNINIVNKISKFIDNPMLQFDVKATNLYSLLNSQVKINSDFTTSPIIFKEY